MSRFGQTRGDRPDVRVLHWDTSMDGPWSAASARRFRDEKFDGLALLPDHRWAPRNLDFLHELDGLRLFSYSGRLKDDLAAFAVTTLEELTLVTGCTASLPPTDQPNLSSLVLTARPGLTVSERWPALTALRLGMWRDIDLQMLRGAEHLRHIYLEGRRQQGTLDGLQDCRAAQSLLLVDYAISGGIGPLRDLAKLRELKLLAARPTPAHAPLDLSILPGDALHKVWISNAGGLNGLEAVARWPVLRELRLLDCALTDADRQVLSALPGHVSVQVVGR